MRRLQLVTTIEAPLEHCFDLSRDIDVHRRSMDSHHEQAVGGITTGLIGLEEEVTWRARHFGIIWQMTSRIVEFDRPNCFVDEMQHGPFALFRHVHRFEKRDEMTEMVDVIDYGLPLGTIGAIADTIALGSYLRRLFEARNRYIKAAAESS